jgi:putative phosphoesterase
MLPRRMKRSVRPTVREEQTTLALPDGAGRIAVVADTHSQPHPRIAEHLRRLAPAAIFHAGDIGDLAVLEELGAHAPLYAVRGNIDVRAHDLPDVLAIDVTGRPSGTFRILMTHIAVAGPKIRADVARRARALSASLIVCGHSHVPFIGGDRGLTVFNPGSIGPRRFSLPIMFGTIDVTPTRLALTHIDCETGRPWTPP